MRLVADYHTHTVHSHGKGTVLANVAAAARAGLAEVGISDHGPANLFGVGVRDLGSFEQIRAEAEEAMARVPGVRVLTGVEANVISLDGRLDVPRSLQERLDYVMAGLHVLVRPADWIEAAGVWAVNLAGRYSATFARRARALNTKAVVEAVRRNEIDAITHPGYRLPIDTPELARACAARETALEVNTSHPHTTVAFVQAALREGVDFVVGSDAHQPARVGDLAAGARLLEAAGVPWERVRNAVPEGDGRGDGPRGIRRRGQAHPQPEPRPEHREPEPARPGIRRA